MMGQDPLQDKRDQERRDNERRAREKEQERHYRIQRQDADQRAKDSARMSAQNRANSKKSDNGGCFPIILLIVGTPILLLYLIG